MEGKWPLKLDGVECGTVTAESRGAYTVFTARALYTGEVKRISLYGGGVEGYLGVLAPDGDGVSLTRSFTRRDLASFPSAPEYAAEAGQSPEPGTKPEPEPEQVTAEPAGEPETAPSGDEPLWYAAPDGTLSRFDGERLLVALPCRDLRLPDWASGALVRIDGREYVVFPR